MCDLVLESRGARHTNALTGASNEIMITDEARRKIHGLTLGNLSDLHGKLDKIAKGIHISPDFLKNVIMDIPDDEKISITEFKDLLKDQIKEAYLTTTAVGIFKRAKGITDKDEAYAKYMQLSDTQKSMYLTNAEVEKGYIANPSKESDKFSRAADGVFSWLEKNDLVDIPTEREIDARVSPSELDAADQFAATGDVKAPSKLDKLAQELENPFTRDEPIASPLKKERGEKAPRMSPEDIEAAIGVDRNVRGKLPFDDESIWNSDDESVYGSNIED